MRARLLVVATLAALLSIPQGSEVSFAELSHRAPTCLGLAATIAGTGGDDHLVGGPGDDVIAAGDGDDVVRGRGGSDVLCGDRGTDDLDGGDGDDRLAGGRNGLQQPYPDNAPDNVGDHLVGGSGDDVLDPGYDTDTDGGGGFLPDTISYADAPTGLHVDLAAGPGIGLATGDGTDTLVLQGRVSLYGSAYDDVLVSGDFADDLVDGAGADLLRGGKGRDSLQGDEGGLPSSDTVPYDDRVYGGPGGDGIYLGNGDDELETDMEFADGSRVDGGPGVDETYVWSVDVDGRRRLDAVGRIDLGTGRFAMRLGERRRTAVLAGVERLRIPDGHWTVLGTAADETFYGGDAGRDAIEVLARGGDDFVSGTPGDDVLVGGSGRDEAVYVGAGDRVTGFEVVRD